MHITADHIRIALDAYLAEQPQEKPELDVVRSLLGKPSHLVAATCDMDGGRDKAYRWLEQQLAEQPRGDWDLPAEAQMRHVGDCLDRRADVVWGYYSERGRIW